MVWRYKRREPSKKPTKVPYCAHAPGVEASTTDPATWSGFATALAVRGIAGQGFVFSPDDPYCGLDFDDCVAEGEIHPAVAGYLDVLDSYAEFSPSGSGVHVIVRAALEQGRKINRTPWGGPFECYCQGRYFTVTGNPVPGRPTAISERPRTAEVENMIAELDPPKLLPKSKRDTGTLRMPAALDDHELIDRAMAAKNGASFAALWRGDASGYASASEADLALVSRLAFWTGGHAGRIDALFRQSGLMREKREQRSDYRARTIGKALDSRTECYEPAGRRLHVTAPRPIGGGS